MTPDEQWDYIHSDENIGGLNAIQKADAEAIQISGRRVGMCSGLDTRAKDIMMALDRVVSCTHHPETQEMWYQSLEYTMAQFVMEAATALVEVGKIQDYLHGARQSNLTICKLLKERKDAEAAKNNS